MEKNIEKIERNNEEIAPETPYGTFKTRDGLSIRFGVWKAKTTPAKATIVLLNGRSEFMEKYLLIIEKLQIRGLDVYSMDWRGQGLSDRSLENRHKGYVKSFNHYIIDLHDFMEKHVLPGAQKPVYMLAHSMGGHIAIRYLHDYPGKVKKVILDAPMINIKTFPMPIKVARWMATRACKSGKHEEYIIGAADFKKMPFPGNLLTSDYIQFQRGQDFVDENPDLVLGGVTYGWLNASFDSMELTQKKEYARAIDTPMLILSAGDEEIVSNKAQKLFSNAAKNCIYKEIKNSRHEIMMENDKILVEFWKAFENFFSL